MQELLKTLIINPYDFIAIIALILVPIGLIISIIALSFRKPNSFMFKTGMTLVAVSLLLPVLLNNISTTEQEKAIQNIQAYATTETNTLLVHSQSKWIEDGSFEIVSENSTHYFVKNGRKIIEVNKLEMQN